MKWIWITLVIIAIISIIIIVLYRTSKPGEMPGTLPDKFTMPSWGGTFNPNIPVTSYSKDKDQYWKHMKGGAVGIMNKLITKQEYKRAYKEYIKIKEANKSGDLPQ